MTAHQNDADLVQRSTAGDRAAFGELVQRWENAAFATAFSVLRERSDAEDVVQTAFVTAWIRLDQLKDRRSFGAWLRTIVRSKALELARRRNTVVFVSTDAPADVAEQHVADCNRHSEENTRTDVWEAIGHLPRKYREVIAASLRNGFTRQQLAEYLGLPLSTVKGRIQQARLLLRDYLSDDTEEIPVTTMKDKVDTSIARIAREEIDMRIPVGAAKRIVLYSGVSSDIEICRTDGDEVRITGSKTSLGHDEADAQRSVQGIRILHDEVESYMESGPHHGEKFCGTNVKDGQPVAITSPIGGIGRFPTSGSEAFKYSESFPEIEPRSKALEELAESFGAALRITINREKVEDIILPRDAVTEEIGREFIHNFSDDGIVHGPRGMVHLVVAVPSGVEVVAIGSGSARRLRIWGLRSNVLVTGFGTQVELEDIEGDVRLIQATARSIRGIRGRVMQLDYDMRGSSSREYRATRMYGSSSISDVTGEIDIDVAKVDMDISNIAGHVRVRNRWGATSLNLTEYSEESAFSIESDSGNVTVKLTEAVWETVDMLAHTIAGVIDYSPVQSDFSHTRNDVQLISWTNKPAFEGPMNPAEQKADITVLTRSGIIRIENTD